MRRIVLGLAILVLAISGVALAVVYFNGADSTKVAAEVAALNDGSDGYCHRLTTMPQGFETAVGNAAAGAATGSDKKIITGVATQLRGATSSDDIPPSLKKKVSAAAKLLDKLSGGAPLSKDEAMNFAATFQEMGEAVKKTCSAK